MQPGESDTARRDLRASCPAEAFLSDTPSITRNIKDLPAIRRPPPTPGRTVGPPPALQAAPGTRGDSLGAFLVVGATWVADGPQNLPATLKTHPESFRLWRVAGGQDSHLLCFPSLNTSCERAPAIDTPANDSRSAFKAVVLCARRCAPTPMSCLEPQSAPTQLRRPRSRQRRPAEPIGHRQGRGLIQAGGIQTGAGPAGCVGFMGHVTVARSIFARRSFRASILPISI
jgi:hypothetical protein